MVELTANNTVAAQWVTTVQSVTNLLKKIQENHSQSALCSLLPERMATKYNLTNPSKPPSTCPLAYRICRTPLHWPYNPGFTPSYIRPCSCTPSWNLYRYSLCPGRRGCRTPGLRLISLAQEFAHRQIKIKIMHRSGSGSGRGSWRVDWPFVAAGARGDVLCS